MHGGRIRSLAKGLCPPHDRYREGSCLPPNWEHCTLFCGCARRRDDSVSCVFTSKLETVYFMLVLNTHFQIDNSFSTSWELWRPQVTSSKWQPFRKRSVVIISGRGETFCRVFRALRAVHRNRSNDKVGEERRCFRIRHSY